MALWPRMRPESRWIGGDADGGGELVAADGAEFGQFGKESAHGDVADAGNGFRSASASRQTGDALMASPMSPSISLSSFSRNAT
jgi:hypothetical protein